MNDDQLIFAGPSPDVEGGSPEEFAGDASFVFALSGSGGNTYDETASGGVVAGGSSIVAINEPSTGGVVMGSSATITAKYSITASGGSIVGGSAVPGINEPSSSGAVAGSSATIVVKYNITASGGGVVGGLTDTHNYTEIPSGGIVISGLATAQEKMTIVASGGMILGGVDNFTYNITASGGIAIGGTNVNLKFIMTSGGIVIGGQLLHVPQIYTGPTSGGVRSGGSGGVSLYIPPPTGPDAIWLNPELALIYNDGLETFADVSYGKQSQFLVVRGFRMGVAADNNVLSILINLRCRATNTMVQDTEVYLVNSSGIISDNLAKFSDWPVGAEAVRLYNLSNDLQPILSPSMVNDPEFGVAIRVRNFNNLGVALAKVDGMFVAATYEDPVGQRLRVSGNAFVLSTAMSYQGGGDVNVDGATASYSIKRYFSEQGSGGVLLGGSADEITTHNIVASGGVVLGLQAKITPYIEVGRGGAVGSGVALVKPYFEFGLGGMSVGGSADVRTLFRSTAKGGVSVGGTVFAVFYHYPATGGLTTSGSAYIRSSAWHYQAGGSVFISGSATIHGSYLGTFMETGGFESTVSELIVNYPQDQNVPTAAILSQNVEQCECLQIPLLVNFTQNLAVNNKLSQFLFRNNFAFPSIHKLAFNQSNTSWQSNLHYKGVSVDGSGPETWDLVMELQCTKLAGGIDIGRTIWKLAVDITRRASATFNTRLIVGVLPSSICDTISHELIFKVTYDTQNNTALVDPSSTIYQAILFDNIGLFKSKYWVDNPDLVLKVSQAALDSPQTRLDLTSQVLVN